MPVNTTPTSELEAVNTLLGTIGEIPVNSLGSGLPEAATAERILSEINRAVQSEGWNFNTELNFPLTKTSDGEITVPGNCLEIDDTSLTRHGEFDYVRRGARIYDRLNHTYKLEKDLRVNMVILLDFEDIPEAARHYITIRAARIFQDRILGSGEIHEFTDADEHFARIRLKKHKLRTGDYSMKNNTLIHSIINRRFY